jgi:hypothetical protein
VVRWLGGLGCGFGVVVWERRVREASSLRSCTLRIQAQESSFITSVHITSSFYRPPTSRRRRPHPLHNIRLRLNITDLSTLPTFSRLSVGLEFLHSLLNLRPQIRTMETLLMHLPPTTLTKPHQRIQTPLGPRLLNNHAHRIRKPHRIMRNVPRKQEEFALVDVNVFEFVCGGFDCFEEHAAFVLVEEFRGGVEVVVCAGVGAAYDHDGHGVVVD